MQKSIFILVFLGIMTSTLAQDSENKITTYFLVRHAEKMRNNPSEQNPDLSEQGLKRAQKWKEILKHILFDAIYSTNFIRTIKTVESIAITQSIDIQLYHPTNIDFHQFKQETIGKNVLIVGHSNTITKFVNTLIQQEKYKEMDDAEFSNLYIVTINGNQITDLLLYIDF